MLDDVKSIANIIFFITLSVVGVLTYRHARKTVFAPLRTETFKLQLKVLEELLQYFQHKSETDFIEEFDLHRIFGLNSLQLRDTYVDQFFSDKLKVDEARSKKAYEPLRYALIHADALEPVGEDDHRKPPPQPRVRPETPALELAEWRKYRHDVIGYTDEYQQKSNTLRKFIASPLLPQDLRDKLREFERVAGRNLLLVGSVLTEVAQQLPEKFSTVDDVQKFKSDWAWNRFNDKAFAFEPTAQEILNFINDYLRVDSLTNLDT